MSYLSRMVRENWISPEEQQSRLRALAIQKAVDLAAKHMRKLGREEQTFTISSRSMNGGREPVSYRGRAG